MEKFLWCRRPDPHIPPLEYRRVVGVSAGDVHIETGCGGGTAGVTGDIEVEADRVYRASRRAGASDIKVEASQGVGAGGDDTSVSNGELQSFGAGGCRIG